MSATTLTCGMCGHHFDPDSAQVCTSCPINSGCAMICCPACGASDIDPSRSRLARWIAARLSRRAPRAQLERSATFADLPIMEWAPRGQPLTTVVPGSGARVLGFGPQAVAWSERLQGYGMVPGHEVWVIRQSPMTVVRIEETELALEGEVAGAIWVEPPPTRS